MDTSVSDHNDIPSGESVEEKVSYETHKKLLAQRKADQEKIKNLQLQFEETQKALNLIKDKEREVMEEKAKGNGDFKALLENRENEIKTLQEQLNSFKSEKESLENSFIDMVKLSAFNEALGGKIKHKKFYSLVELDKIAIDPETKRVDSSTLKDYVKNFTTEFKDIIEFKDAKMNENAASRGQGYSYEDYLAATRSGDAKKAREIMGKLVTK